MILKRILWKYSVNRIHLAQDMDHWRAVTNTVMDLQVPYKAVNLVNSLATISVSKYSYFTRRALSPVDALVFFSGDTRSRGLKLKSTGRSRIHCGLRPLEQHALLHGIVGLWRFIIVFAASICKPQIVYRGSRCGVLRKCYGGGV